MSLICRATAARIGLQLFGAALCIECCSAGDETGWPTITRQMRPWTYWWWMGSAVDRTNITQELERFRDAGFGGVHIIPIYGAKGYEESYIRYLTPEWLDMLKHTVTEAERRDLGVDMTTGSGWCFGGPNVRDNEANATLQVKTYSVPAGGKIDARFDRQTIQALVAYPDSGPPSDITRKVNDKGAVDWSADGAACKVLAVTQKPSGQKVKRPAPGGEGHMLNLLYRDGVSHWIERFTEAFAQYKGPKPRAMYHDSYEYRSDWSPDFLAQFEKRRGYRLQEHLPELLSRELNNETARVKCDYRETASDILCEETIPLWVQWSRERGFATRNQAHGSPGNLLDLYAAVTTPETEMFNRDRNKLISKFASSAAHVAGRPLVSAETGTWLKEHFTEKLADLKYLQDDLFLSGVNHIFYHGNCYSPEAAPWPGWLFYASTEMNSRNSIWRDVPALNTYAARCQSILQAGAPDNDLLVYWPIHDFWRSAGGMLPSLTVHARAWFEDQSIGRAAEHLWKQGFAFDYISDRQIPTTTVKNQLLVTPGGSYQAMVVPKCETMPLATLKNLFDAASAGAIIIFEAQLPKDVPGMTELETQRKEFQRLKSEVSLASVEPALTEARLGRGRIMVGSLDSALRHASVQREKLVDHAGLGYVRRRAGGYHNYFVANRGTNTIRGWIPLAKPFQSALLLDPLTGKSGAARARSESKEVYLNLEAGESVIVRVFTNETVNTPAWEYAEAGQRAMPLEGTWRVEFISGGPSLPASTNLAQLRSWTQLGNPETERFAGTARYTIQFDAPDAHSRMFLDLGIVEQSAKARLNGEELGTCLAPPFRFLASVKPTANELVVEVTSVAANRIRDLDRRGVKWKTFNDINLVNMDYKPFDASNWPLQACGLIGPVTLRHAVVIENP